VTVTTFSTATVEKFLSRVGRDVRRAMLGSIPDAEPHRWLYHLVRSYPSRPGKALRPALCLSACRAYGGSDEEAFPIAVAIEMLHNAFLVHDDVADGSELRRGRPTLPAAFGDALSLNAGDALVVLANQVLRRHTRSLDPALADRILDEFDKMAKRTLQGQAPELGCRRDALPALSPEYYLSLILNNTCWYTTIHP
jgi:geranylgeranyl diphosphate synthase type II